MRLVTIIGAIVLFSGCAITKPVADYTQVRQLAYYDYWIQVCENFPVKQAMIYPRFRDQWTEFYVVDRDAYMVQWEQVKAQGAAEGMANARKNCQGMDMRADIVGAGMGRMIAEQLSRTAGGTVTDRPGPAPATSVDVSGSVFVYD